LNTAACDIQDHSVALGLPPGLGAGKHAFHRETLTDTIAAVLEREPDWHALPPATPAAVRDLLRRCLQKDKDRRLRDIGDARIEIEEALAGSNAAPEPGMAVKIKRHTIGPPMELSAIPQYRSADGI
jgi:hypothetical protein